VQVASFSKRANADDLRQRLRADGFEAFLSTEQRANGPMTRVAIGPFQSRADAVEVRDAVSRRYDVTARLMAFSL
jgi:cell division septation protein DedD